MSNFNQGVANAIANIQEAKGANVDATGAYANAVIRGAKQQAGRLLETAVIATGVGAAGARLAANRRDTIANFQPDLGSDPADDPTLPYLGKIFGLPIYGSITLGARQPSQNPLTWIDDNGQQQTLPELVIASAVITATPSKSVVKTNIQGRDGSIKEYIGANDVDITIDCTLNFSTNQGRGDIMTQINLLYSAPLAIPVTNYYLNMIGVYFIVIEQMPYTQKRGEYSNLYFTIQACSDTPVTEVLP